jgi:hypothetical protein
MALLKNSAVLDQEQTNSIPNFVRGETIRQTKKSPRGWNGYMGTEHKRRKSGAKTRKMTVKKKMKP